jgi:hypothetical protein
MTKKDRKTTSKFEIEMIESNSSSFDGFFLKEHGNKQEPLIIKEDYGESLNEGRKTIQRCSSKLLSSLCQTRTLIWSIIAILLIIILLDLLFA